MYWFYGIPLVYSLYNKYDNMIEGIWKKAEPVYQ